MKPIYVEVSIEADIEEIWNATQVPELHEQWDLRFSSITYLPKNKNEPQCFTYSRSVFPFLTVEGWGKSVGAHHKENGIRSSSLHFGTDQFFSPIREGRGYWKYEPQEKDVTFLTQYDYDVNFGKTGKIIDRLLFRPLIGWATALSFDVLKRWLEKGEVPRSQYLRFFSTYAIMLVFSIIWFYQGLVPKVIAMHPAEREMIGNAFALSENGLTTAVLIIGWLEIGFGLLWLCLPNKRPLFLLQLLLFPALTLAAVFTVPSTALHPFNPVTFNFTLIALSAIGWFMSKDVPSAKSCKRERR